MTTGSVVVIPNACEHTHETGAVAVISMYLALCDRSAVNGQHGVYGLGEVLDEAGVK